MLEHAHTAGRVTLTPDAGELWWHTYPQLTGPPTVSVVRLPMDLLLGAGIADQPDRLLQIGDHARASCELGQREHTVGP